MASKIPKITGISIIHLGPVFKLMVPSDGGDHAGEVHLAVKHNTLAGLHLILIMMIGTIDYNHHNDHQNVYLYIFTVMLYIRSGSIWGSPQVLTAKNCFPFILSFVKIIVIISPSSHVSLSFILVIPPLQWSSVCNANKKS